MTSKCEGVCRNASAVRREDGGDRHVFQGMGVVHTIAWAAVAFAATSSISSRTEAERTCTVMCAGARPEALATQAVISSSTAGVLKEETSPAASSSTRAVCAIAVVSSGSSGGGGGGNS